MSARDTSRRGEHGFFLIWVALMMSTLLGVSALAVEWNHLEQVGTRMQKAADAGALGGVVFMPDDFEKAEEVALEVATKNGFTDGVDGTEVDVELGERPTQLRVTIRRPITLVFVQVLGVDDQDVGRTALAEYEGPVEMGSPINQFGNDPVDGSGNGTPTYPGMWASVEGPDTPKRNGDAIHGELCYTNQPPNLSREPDNCAHPEQYDYEENGYFYSINVHTNAAGDPLKIELFDPGFVEVGDNCDGSLGSLLGEAAALPQTPSFNPTVYPGSAPFDPAVVYAPKSDPGDPSSDGVRYCSGDVYRDADGFTTPVRTSVILRGPDDTPWNPADNPIIGDSCSLEFPGRRGNLADMVQETTSVDTAPAPVAAYFRQWYPMCETTGGPIAEEGTYFVQVTTAFRKDGVTPVPSTNGRGSGANRFSVRAGLGDVTTGSDLTIYGDGEMGIYTNRGGSFARFYLARVPPASVSRTLVVDLFDIGDIAGGATGDLTVLPPVDGSVDGAPLGSGFVDCTWAPPPSSSGNRIFTPFPGGQAYGPFEETAGGCRIPDVNNSEYDGHWVRVRIPIPTGYDCAVESPTGCWTRIDFDFSGAASIQDTTTWRAFIEGNTARLVE